MRYGAVTALADATFEARTGEVVGLLGPNGAGKTTTMRILTTYQIPSAGAATVAGYDVIAQPLEVRRRIGYLPETLPLYLSMEVRECLQFVGRARGLRGRELKERIDWVVGKCGLDRMFRSPVLELSKGYRQRTALAQALVHDPEVVILDEPTTGLDPHQILEIRALIEELASERTVILSTHILQEASALADRLLVMSRGRIVGAGTPDELRDQAGARPRVRLHVSGARAGEAAAALGMLPQSGEVTVVEAGDGTALLDVVETAPGLLDAAGRWAHDAGLAVLELSREEGSLEDVFLALTSADWAAESAPAASAGDTEAAA
jgi:ABC-2 type transport system ATP-binding protein